MRRYPSSWRSLTKWTALGIAILSSLVVPTLTPGQKNPLQHEVTVVNVEVPVRVYDGDRFVENLTLDDVEVFENGKPQKIEALYLIKKEGIARKEGAPSLKPDVSRYFILCFEAYEKDIRFEEVLDEFFLKVVRPGDTVHIVSPEKAYNLKPKAIEKLGAKATAEEIKKKVEGDVFRSGSVYRALIRQLEDLHRPGEANDELHRMREMELLKEIIDFRTLDQKHLLAFADFLKAASGQKHAFFFYQTENVPFPPDISDEDRLTLMRSVGIDLSLVQKKFADSSATVHFIFLKPRGFPHLDPANPYVQKTDATKPFTPRDIVEYTPDLFTSFLEISRATGGISESTQNPVWALQKAAESADRYYLLYYKPENYKPDGSFKKIEVKLKKRGLSVLYRQGYYAK